MLMTTIEEILSGSEYEALVNLLLDLKEQEPQEIQVKSRCEDGSGYRVGYCDGCGAHTIVYEWHTAEIGGDVCASLCPECNGGRKIVQVKGHYYLVRHAHYCLNCGEPILNGSWCSDECAEAWIEHDREVMEEIAFYDSFLAEDPDTCPTCGESVHVCDCVRATQEQTEDVVFPF